MPFFFLEKKGIGSEMVEIGVIMVNTTLCMVNFIEQ